MSGFDGHADRWCRMHRPMGKWHAWCEDCNENCWRHQPCLGCARIPLDDLKAEIQVARDRWGDQLGFPPSAWLAILVEEVGEVARIVCEHLSAETGRSDYPEHLDALRSELEQVAAVSIRWRVALDERGRAREAG
jgi:NTP pyrophosphatase (non-canonical NTP hydrolase)